MRFNQTIAISTPKVLLVPYRKHHVRRYHEWMEDEYLREVTASDRLTLDEEYDMQRQWTEDLNKLTFIICQPLDDLTTPRVLPQVNDSPERMVGDVNLFLELQEGEYENRLVGELEIMIAEESNRHHGFGREAVNAFLIFVRNNQDLILDAYYEPKQGQEYRTIDYIMVKPKASNTASVALFESLGFQALSYLPNVFQELELRRNLESPRNQCAGARLLPYGWITDTELTEGTGADAGPSPGEGEADVYKVNGVYGMMNSAA